jgi:hypothetical protein
VSEDQVRGTLRAQARMREILDTDVTEKAWNEVTSDGYRVDVTVSPVQTKRTETIGVKLLMVDLTLSWRQGNKNRVINLKTLKLVRPVDHEQTGLPS